LIFLLCVLCALAVNISSLLQFCSALSEAACPAPILVRYGGEAAKLVKELAIKIGAWGRLKIFSWVAGKARLGQ